MFASNRRLGGFSRPTRGAFYQILPLYMVPSCPQKKGYDTSSLPRRFVAAEVDGLRSAGSATDRRGAAVPPAALEAARRGPGRCPKRFGCPMNVDFINPPKLEEVVQSMSGVGLFIKSLHYLQQSLNNDHYFRERPGT